MFCYELKDFKKFQNSYFIEHLWNMYSPAEQPDLKEINHFMELNTRQVSLYERLFQS